MTRISSAPPRRVAAGKPILLLLIVAAVAGYGMAPDGGGDPPDGPVEPASLLIRGGAVWTGVPAGGPIDGIAVAGDRIVAVGTDEKLAAHRTAETRVLDLDGGLVVPGFIDSHVHFSSAGRLLLGVNLLNVDEQAEFVAAIRAAHERMPPNAWIVGGDWSAYQRWPKGADRPREGDIDYFEPRRQSVDPVTPDRPVFVSRFDRKVWFANGAALEAAGIDADTPDPDGGTIERDPETGEPTGILRGAAADLVREVVPEPSHAQRMAETRVALKRVRENGVTTFHDMSPSYQLRLYQEMLRRGELTARVHYRPTLDRYELLAELGIQAGFGGDRIRLGAVKGFVDGIMGNSSALFFEPYEHQPDNRGRLREMMHPEGNMLRLLRGADAAGLQVTVHAIGDAANRLLLDLLQQVIEEHGPRDRRFRVVHAQVVHPDDLPRFGELDLIAEVQPVHTIDDMRWMEDRIGERSRWAYPFASLKENGAILSFGSDWPGTNAAWYPISPLLGIYAAVTRQTVGGLPPGGWYPDERVSVETALRAYTVNNAYAGFDEERLGTLEPGKLADITVVDRDLTAVPAREIRDAGILYTIVGGRIVYEAAPSGAGTGR